MANRGRVLVEFKAGKCTFDSKLVTPEKEKGLIQLTQGADSIISFLWKNRTTGMVESTDEQFIFREEAVFKRVRQCKTGRVFLLEFVDSKRKLFFWSQEPAEDKDDEFVKKINEYINNPPSLATQISTLSGTAASSSSSTSSGPNSAPLQSAPSSSATSASSGSGSSGNDMGLSSILRGLGLPQSATSNLGGSRPAQNRPQTNLQHLMDPNALIPLIENDPQLRERIYQLLPENARNPEGIRQLMRSPQFAQVLRQFTGAMQSGGLGALLSQMGLQQPSSSSQAEGVDPLLQALQSQYPQNPSSSSSQQSSSSSSSSQQSSSSSSSSQQSSSSSSQQSSSSSSQQSSSSSQQQQDPEKKDDDDMKDD